jgi:hypothetical protein
VESLSIGPHTMSDNDYKNVRIIKLLSIESKRVDV